MSLQRDEVTLPLDCLGNGASVTEEMQRKFGENSIWVYEILR